jgi:facilitated trehalose transporter
MLMGSLIAGPIANLIGRKWTCIFGTCGCLASSYALIAGAQWLWMLLLGRFLHGTGLGFSTTVSTIYIMEIATPDMRGRMAVVPAIAGTLGVITCHILGSFLNWQWLAIVFASLNVPFFLLLIFIPETPVYLIGKNKIEPAHKILRILRGKTWDVTEELTNIKIASESEVKQKVN